MINKYNYIINSLKLMSLPYDRQILYFPDFADIPDEIVSNFETAFLYLPEVIEEGYFSNVIIASIIRTYNKFSWCLRNIGIENLESKEWDEVRYMANKILVSINIDNFNLDIDLI